MDRTSLKNRSNSRLLVSFLPNRWKVALLIFLVAFSVRLATLNKMGKIWDEGAYVELGHRYIELAVRHDFTNSYWYLQSDHPPLARYIYGLASIFDSKNVEGKIIFNNSYTVSRAVSALMGSLSVLFIVFLGYKYFSSYVAISSGLIFALIPFFVGLSQIGTLESPLMLFFTGTLFFFLEFEQKNTKKNLIFTGILLGCSILVKQSNIIIIPLLLLLATVRNLIREKKLERPNFISDVKNIAWIILVAFLTCFTLWPMPFFHLGELMEVQNKMWVHAVRLPPPEVYFGVLRLVPKPYYVVMFLITTPIVLLVLGILGGIKVLLRRKFIMIVVLVWFLFPFLQTFYPFKQHGVRYIIEIYAPFSLLCGIGLEFFCEGLKKAKYVRAISISFVVIYLCLVLSKVSPYYLDYFNEIIGGNNYVYQHKLFQMGWWGQGIEEAANFISSQEKGRVLVAIDGPLAASVMPHLLNIQTVLYDKNLDADYVIVPYFNVVRLGFSEEELRGRYKEVYSVFVDKAKLVKVYKRI